MKPYLLLFIFLGILANISVSISQENNSDSFPSDTVKAYTGDGQEHIIYLKKNIPAKINAVFYPNFNYKIAISPENNDLLVEINFLDQNGNVQFTNADKKYIREWNFTFQSLMSGIIELKVKNSIDKKEEQVHVAILHQPTDD